MSSLSSSSSSRRTVRSSRRSTRLRVAPYRVMTSAVRQVGLTSITTVRKVFRFQSSNGAFTALTSNSLLCAAGTVCTVANTTVTSFWGAMRLLRVEIVSPPPSQGSDVTALVNWAGSTFTPSRVIMSSSNSVARGARVVTSPPSGSIASFWQLASSTTLCSLNAFPGSYINVTLELMQQDDSEAVASASISAGTLGTVYYLSADSNSTNYYTPTSLITTH